MALRAPFNIRRISLVLLLGIGYATQLYSQEENAAPYWDSNYLEDQFYIGITYNFLLNQPQGVNQQSLSYGIQTGFIKDIPLNRSRTTGIGIGLGYAVNSYYTNLRATQLGDQIIYSILDEDDFTRNKVETHLIESPIEFRWRNSDVTNYKFWRIYTGFKLGYVIGGRSKFVFDEDNSKDSFFNDDLQKFQYGLTFNVGYNTFNIHTYYGLNQLFGDSVRTDQGDAVGLRPLRIGIIFYIF